MSEKQPKKRSEDYSCLNKRDLLICVFFKTKSESENKVSSDYLKPLCILLPHNKVWPSTNWPLVGNQPERKFFSSFRFKQEIKNKKIIKSVSFLFVCFVFFWCQVYLEVSSVQSSIEMLPDLHQFGTRTSGTWTWFDGILLQVCLEFAFPQQQLAQVIYMHAN